MGPNPLLNAMGATHFAVMGVSRSYLDFYMGFGWALSIAGLSQAFVLWQMARLANAGGTFAMKPMIGLRRGAQPVSALAKGLPVSRPAVSQHLKILKDAGLVIDRADGTRRIYRIDQKGLAAVRAWFDGFWDDALDAFRARAEQSSKKDKSR